MNYIAWKALCRGESGEIASPIYPSPWRVEDVPGFGPRLVLHARDGDVERGVGVFAASAWDARHYGDELYLVAPLPDKLVMLGGLGWRAEAAFVLDGPFGDGRPIEEGYRVIAQAAASGYKFVPGVLLEAIYKTAVSEGDTGYVVRDSFEALVPHLEEIASETGVKTMTSAVMRAICHYPDDYVDLARLARESGSPGLAGVVVHAIAEKGDICEASVRDVLCLAFPFPDAFARVVEAGIGDEEVRLALMKLSTSDSFLFESAAEIAADLYAPGQILRDLCTDSEAGLRLFVETVSVMVERGYLDSESALDHVAQRLPYSLPMSVERHIARFLATIGRPTIVLDWPMSVEARFWIAEEAIQIARLKGSLADKSAERARIEAARRNLTGQSGRRMRRQP